MLHLLHLQVQDKYTLKNNKLTISWWSLSKASKPIIYKYFRFYKKFFSIVKVTADIKSPRLCKKNHGILWWTADLGKFNKSFKEVLLKVGYISYCRHILSSIQKIKVLLVRSKKVFSVCSMIPLGSEFLKLILSYHNWLLVFYRAWKI